MRKKEFSEDELELLREFDQLGEHPEMTDVAWMIYAAAEVVEQDEQEACNNPMGDFTRWEISRKVAKNEELKLG